MKIDEDGICILAEAVLRQKFFGGHKRVVQHRLHKQSCHDIDDQDFFAVGEGVEIKAFPRRAFGIVEGAQNARFGIDGADEFFLSPDVIAGGEYVDAEGKKFLRQFVGDAETGSCIFGVGDDHVRLQARFQIGQMPGQTVAPATPHNIAEKENFHAWGNSILRGIMSSLISSCFYGSSMFFAPAKLNLYLHITGRRADDYHDLDSLVAFAGVGDEVRLVPAKEFQFVLEGPQAALLKNEPADGNLVVRAAQSLARLVGKPLDVKITLVKRLPVASGIGGGSSDAAAALRALAEHWSLSPDDPRLVTAAAEHGQDVPVCLKIENNYITAEGTISAPALPRAGVVLVNPNKALPTPAVYKEFRAGGYPFSPLARLTETPRDVPALIAELKKRGNDLYKPALKLMPEIGDIISALETANGCLLARMSGSGATCFGLFADGTRAKAAAEILQVKHSGWWIEASVLPFVRGKTI